VKYTPVNFREFFLHRCCDSPLICLYFVVNEVDSDQEADALIRQVGNYHSIDEASGIGLLGLIASDCVNSSNLFISCFKFS
jgi:hypothetical protein